MSFKKVLIANRGEIALRIIRACKELGLATIAVHSEVDADALHVRFADQAICIGPASPAESYLNIPAIISAAEIVGADAVHPGYGFLSENHEFAELCNRCGLVFIGPSAKLIKLMGDKVQARQTMSAAGVPILPGTGVLETEDSVREAADKIGYPVIIKASAGGGGRGMKIVNNSGELVSSWVAARTEAMAGFGCADVYLERFVGRPRHIEVQVFGDQQGNIVHLGERECSIQRRHQKLVEEAPSTALSADQRRELGQKAVKACRAIGYHNAGTLEFLMDEKNRCYFMEMNTRIQVEHTVTEEVTGYDLVQEQLLVAAGEPISFSQSDIRLGGHSIECRINAEDARTFVPSPGRITGLNLPGGYGVRVDTAVYEGYVVPPNYDSMIAKLIVRGSTRARAISRAKRALSEFVVEGISTNIDLFKRILDTQEFETGDLDTTFLQRVQII